MTRAGDAFENPVARLCGVRATYAQHVPLPPRQAQHAGRATRIAA